MNVFSVLIKVLTDPRICCKLCMKTGYIDIKNFVETKHYVLCFMKLNLEKYFNYLKIKYFCSLLRTLMIVMIRELIK